MTIRNKILGLFTALTVSIILMMAAFAYFLVSRQSFDDFYKRLEIRAYIAARARLTQDKDNSAAYAEIRNEHLERLPHEKEFFIRIDTTGSPAPEPGLKPLRQAFYDRVKAEGKATYRYRDSFYQGVLFENEAGKYIVIVSASNVFGQQFMTELRRTLIICMAIAAVVVVTAGLFFSRYILQPVRRITSRVKDIRAHNLHLRLDTPNSKDEMTELAQTFNNMLDRLETAFETQNNFVSNASHELGTPLTAIIGEAELALNKQRNDEQYRQSLSVILKEAERLEHITKSLLSLAQTGFDGKKQQLEKIRTDELIFTVKETIDRINPENKVAIDYTMLPEEEDKLIILGNAQLLQLALSNIVQNACKYSDNRPASVALAATDKNNIIIIKDNGIGIPAQDMPFIYDPFYRASNTGGYKGYGIGLPLARNIIRLHGGNIIVNSKENQGTEIRIVLPTYMRS
ncbi:HAMP domain-containing histidine kinase [Chitinophaga filiformis]|uniref:HAMP domain-containing sensor histidine kinase n=1 Tax=Chitinophaga filiformis TaxID=104663 RepID=UPI001F1CA68B|nr:HAMP domain-containing sensor histidine kinase [Chitinophaga filiformis]MCF6402396.1 HAMP domain-containing histidine kinase [Chitinophaga filiformis]